MARACSARRRNLARFGLIAALRPLALNPGLSAVGLARDPGEDALRHVGPTCTACHIAVVTVDGTLICIDGAPTHLDFDSLYGDLTRVVTANAFDPGRFMRLAGRVPGPAPEAQTRALQQAFNGFHLTMA